MKNSVGRMYSTVMLVAMGLLGEGCGDILGGSGDGSGGTYACSYESRSSGCGGVGWSDWTAQCYQFNIDDYQEGWTPERVCNKYTGSDTECGGSCCIYVEYRNTTLKSGTCP